MKPIILMMLIAMIQAPTPAPKVPTNSAAKNSRQIRKKSKEKQNPTASSPLTREAVAPPLNEQRANGDRRKDSSNPVRIGELPPVSVKRDRADWISWGSGLVLAVVGSLGVSAAYKTLRAIQKQTDSVEQSAKAALFSAEALTNTERAWVIASPETNAPKLGFIPEAGDPVGSDQRNIFVCAIKSTGNTPARLIEAAVAYRQVDSLTDLPQEPEYGAKGPLNDVPLVKGDSFAVVAFLEPDSILRKEDLIAVERAERFLYAFGIVAYKDVFDKRHETRFGYIYFFPQGGDPRPVGFRRERLPPAYNRST